MSARDHRHYRHGHHCCMCACVESLWMWLSTQMEPSCWYKQRQQTQNDLCKLMWKFVKEGRTNRTRGHFWTSLSAQSASAHVFFFFWSPPPIPSKPILALNSPGLMSTSLICSGRGEIREGTGWGGDGGIHRWRIKLVVEEEATTRNSNSLCF